MAIRSTMQGMIDHLRVYGSAAADDTYQGQSYWTDAQLQDILDQTGQHRDVLLGRYTDVMYAVTLPRHFRFEDDVIVVDTSELTVAGAVYNPLHNEFTLVSAVSTDLYARGLCVNMYEALAKLWDMKAQQRFDLINWKAGNNRMDVRQEYDACISARDYYRAKTIRRFPRVTGRWTQR